MPIGKNHAGDMLRGKDPNTGAIIPCCCDITSPINDCDWCINGARPARVRIWFPGDLNGHVFWGYTDPCRHEWCHMLRGWHYLEAGIAFPFSSCGWGTCVDQEIPPPDNHCHTEATCPLPFFQTHFQAAMSVSIYRYQSTIRIGASIRGNCVSCGGSLTPGYFSVGIYDKEISPNLGPINCNAVFPVEIPLETDGLACHTISGQHSSGDPTCTSRLIADSCTPDPLYVEAVPT